MYGGIILMYLGRDFMGLVVACRGADWLRQLIGW